MVLPLPLTLTLPSSQPALRSDDIVSLMESCWAQDPNQRPNFLEIQQELQQQQRALEEHKARQEEELKKRQLALTAVKQQQRKQKQK